MLEAAINRILELAKPEILELNSKTYSNKKLQRIPQELTAEPLEVHTLTSVMDYITSGADELQEDIDRRFVLHVAEHNRVSLYHELNDDKARECLLRVTVEPSTFPFGRWLSIEEFIIAMQAYFVPNAMVTELIKLVSHIADENSITTTDTGVSQTATVKTGVALAGKATVPNPVTLAPYRTLNEISQPESSFVFRLKKSEDGVKAALFTADGNAWKNTAITEIKNYFDANIPAEFKDDVIILA